MEQHSNAEEWVSSNYGKPRDWQIIEMTEDNYHAALVKAFEAGAAQAGESEQPQREEAAEAVAVLEWLLKSGYNPMFTGYYLKGGNRKSSEDLYKLFKENQNNNR